MVRFYVSMIQRGEMTLDDVPKLWSIKVRNELGI